MCSGFVHRNDGTLIHDDGTIWAQVKEVQPELKYRYELVEGQEYEQ